MALHRDRDVPSFKHSQDLQKRPEGGFSFPRGKYCFRMFLQHQAMNISPHFVTSVTKNGTADALLFQNQSPYTVRVLLHNAFLKPI